MLLLHHTNADGSCIAVAEMPDGEITPPAGFFSEQEEQEYRQLGSAKRRRERAATLHLLHSALGVEDALHHLPNGTPYLRAGSHRISISHTRNQVAVALHPCREAGVDIEELSRSVAKVAPRYLSAGEREECATQEQQCLAWCAKETVYKLAGEEGVDFAEQIRLNRFDVTPPEGSITAFFTGKNKTASFMIRYRIIGGLAVCYAFA
ncbi:MAG: 4'-phosphopantetheinyl transferase superfamily protein [Prevotellaceae bacterium]|jgi:phosphopantetheinyl transferase|nr:4'-phosphopantetheinyl transferase superfamily protein [Prevotellaceae bacterium]